MSAISTLDQSQPPPPHSHHYGSPPSHSSPSTSSRTSTTASASPNLKRQRSLQNAPAGTAGSENPIPASPRVAALSGSAGSKRSSRDYSRRSGGGSAASANSSPRTKSSPQMRRTTTPRHAASTPPQPPPPQQQQQQPPSSSIEGVDATLASTGIASPTKRAKSEMSKKILPREYYMCPMTDLVILISDMLNELVSLNDDIPLTHGGLTRFHSRAPPTISIHDYLHRIMVHTTLEASTILSMVYYIDLLSNHYPSFTISSLTVHRFLITAATVASKGLCDSFCTNNFYARVGGVSLRELNVLELEFLGRVKWRIVPRARTLQEYYQSLIARMSGGWEIEPLSDRPVAPVGGLTALEAAAVTGLADWGSTMNHIPSVAEATTPRTATGSVSNSSSAFSSDLSSDNSNHGGDAGDSDSELRDEPG